jgi:peroxiredoxin
MNNKFSILLIALALSIFLPTGDSCGQLIANSPYKDATPRAGEFSLKDLQGKVYKLSAQRGKPVLFFFGTTWCPSCRSELPLFKEIYKTYTGRGLDVVYVNIMEPKEKVARFAKANSLPFRVLLDIDGEVANSYEIIGVPTLILIDGEKKIIKISHRTADLQLPKLFPIKK